MGDPIWAKVGSDWDVQRGTVVASGMLADERYALGSAVVTSGRCSFTFRIEAATSFDGHLFLGVAEVAADPIQARTWAFSPPTGNLYVGEQLNEHGSERMAKHFFEDAKESLIDKAEGAVVRADVDMDARTLAFSVNGSETIDSGEVLPEGGVRPWVFMYHEGDSVTLAVGPVPPAPPRPGDS